MKFMGTTITIGDAKRDSVLAGMFTMLVAVAAHGTLASAIIGLVGGAFLGSSLHMLPPVPLAGDDRTGRIVIRAVSGAVGGAGLTGFLRWFLDWAGQYSGSIVQGALLGAVAGCAWYTIWGVWETRAGAPVKAVH